MTTKQNTSREDTLKPDFTVKFMRTGDNKKSFPVKVGVTFPTEKGNQRVHWDVIPAASELRDGVLILVPYQES